MPFCRVLSEKVMVEVVSVKAIFQLIVVCNACSGVIMHNANLLQAILVLSFASKQFEATPQFIASWPYMKTYDLWSADNWPGYEEAIFNRKSQNNKMHDNLAIRLQTKSSTRAVRLQHTKDLRKNKVLNFLPVLDDGECLSDDGRRFGRCLNAYECRRQGGASRGECALGFGVCCVFSVECEQEVKNNITYIVSPNFPSFIPRNLTSCRVKIRIISEDISQLRIDFNHFSLGQPNRQTGVCDGDIFKIIGGLGGIFHLCGQNSGQHIYYDVGGGPRRRTAQQVTSKNLLNKTVSATIPNGPATSTKNEAALSNDPIEILMFFTNSSLVSPRLWEIRIAQIPFSQRAPAGCLQYYTEPAGFIQTFNFAENGRHLANQNYRVCLRQESNMCSVTYEPCHEESFRIGPNNSSHYNMGSTENEVNFASTENFYADTVQLSCATQPNAPAETVSTTQISATQAESSISNVQLAYSDAVEGSGEEEIKPPTPVRGGFDILGFFRKSFGFRSMTPRRSRQVFPICVDRVTIPCIIEDFIEGNVGSLPQCEPVHCGNRFCYAPNGACKVESTVLPFRLGIHFGEGIGKGSPEDNIGMCLRYSQVACI